MQALQCIRQFFVKIRVKYIHFMHLNTWFSVFSLPKTRRSHFNWFGMTWTICAFFQFVFYRWFNSQANLIAPEAKQFINNLSTTILQVYWWQPRLTLCRYRQSGFTIAACSHCLFLPLVPLNQCVCVCLNVSFNVCLASPADTYARSAVYCVRGRHEEGSFISIYILKWFVIVYCRNDF